MDRVPETSILPLRDRIKTPQGAQAVINDALHQLQVNRLDRDHGRERAGEGTPYRQALDVLETTLYNLPPEIQAVGIAVTISTNGGESNIDAARRHLLERIGAIDPNIPAGEEGKYEFVVTPPYMPGELLDSSSQFGSHVRGLTQNADLTIRHNIERYSVNTLRITPHAEFEEARRLRSVVLPSAGFFAPIRDITGIALYQDQKPLTPIVQQSMESDDYEVIPVAYPEPPSPASS